ncbi:hypothetical protein N7453_004644 [Penicillium expansum]|nr:hypothetical protein N7453_004644 [Penicillium expansum]
MIWSLELSEFDIDIMHSSDIASCAFALSLDINYRAQFRPRQSVCNRARLLLARYSCCLALRVRYILSPSSSSPTSSLGLFYHHIHPTYQTRTNDIHRDVHFPNSQHPGTNPTLAPILALSLTPTLALALELALGLALELELASRLMAATGEHMVLPIPRLSRPPTNFFAVAQTTACGSGLSIMPNWCTIASCAFRCPYCDEFNKLGRTRLMASNLRRHITKTHIEGNPYVYGTLIVASGAQNRGS